LLASAGNDETLLQILRDFIDEVVKSGGECTKAQVIETLDFNIVEVIFFKKVFEALEIVLLIGLIISLKGLGRKFNASL